jgi:hypothetical protein
MSMPQYWFGRVAFGFGLCDVRSALCRSCSNKSPFSFINLWILLRLTSWPSRYRSQAVIRRYPQEACASRSSLSFSTRTRFMAEVVFFAGLRYCPLRLVRSVPQADFRLPPFSLISFTASRRSTLGFFLTPRSRSFAAQ